MIPVFLWVALAASVPTIDLPSICRGEQSGVPADQQAGVYKGCMRDEQAAHDEIVKEWTKFPAAARTTCAKLGRDIQSYVEILTCIEIETGSNSPTWNSQAPSAGPAQPAGANATGKPPPM